MLNVGWAEGTWEIDGFMLTEGAMDGALERDGANDREGETDGDAEGEDVGAGCLQSKSKGRNVCRCRRSSSGRLT